jgi:hypothetical protein
MNGSNVNGKSELSFHECISQEKNKTNKSEAKNTHHGG